MTFTDWENELRGIAVARSEADRLREQRVSAIREAASFAHEATGVRGLLSLARKLVKIGALDRRIEETGQ